MGGRDLSRSSFLGGARNTPPQPKRAAITQKGNILQPTPKTATQRLVWGRSAVALDVFNLSGGVFVARRPPSKELRKNAVDFETRESLRPSRGSAVKLTYAVNAKSLST